MQYLNLIDKKQCTGCAACVNICPVNAITMQEDKDTFLYPVVDKNLCINCGKCVSACPAKANMDACLSAITQKKGELNDLEVNQIKESKCAWGCDICQEVCPYTKKAILNGTIYTSIDYFNKNLTPLLKSEDIEKLAKFASKEANPLYPVPKLMSAKELTKIYYNLQA